MFGIHNATVRVRVEGRVIVAAEVVPGTWNPGMYAEVSEAAQAEFRAAETYNPRLAKRLIGRPAHLNPADPVVGFLADAEYVWSPEECRVFLTQAIQRRAIELGAMNVEPRPDTSGTTLRWPADEPLWMITYHPEDNTFSGWMCGATVPEWTRR